MALKMTSKKEALIIVDHGSKRATANDMLLEIVSKYESKSNIGIVEPAHMELAEPSIEMAFDRCVERGAERIICHPFFLSKGRHVQDDIPALVAAAAAKYEGRVSYIITAPLGVQDAITDLIDASVDVCRTSFERE